MGFFPSFCPQVQSGVCESRSFDSGCLPKTGKGAGVEPSTTPCCTPDFDEAGTTVDATTLGEPSATIVTTRGEAGGTGAKGALVPDRTASRESGWPISGSTPRSFGRGFALAPIGAPMGVSAPRTADEESARSGLGRFGGTSKDCRPPRVWGATASNVGGRVTSTPMIAFAFWLRTCRRGCASGGAARARGLTRVGSTRVRCLGFGLGACDPRGQGISEILAAFQAVELV